MADRMTTDSPLVTRARPGLAWRRGQLVDRVTPPSAIIVHTTGAGIRARYVREGARKSDRDDLDTALRVYASIMPASPHYVVDQRGEVGQVCPEAVCAWHVGGAGSAPYHRPGSVRGARYAWWRERWPDLEGPADLAGGQLWAPYIIPPTLAQRARAPLSWGKGSVNGQSIGIEVIPPADAPRGAWSGECWRGVARIVADIALRTGVPLRREHVVTHSDAHPRSRTTPRGEPWDTVPAQWSWMRCEAELTAL